MRTILLLSVTTILGIYLRLSQISPYNFYPDSYQNLLVAYNLATYNSVIGYLGTEGMLYPDFFMWTRPVYPLFINLSKFVIPDVVVAAHVLAFGFGIGSILLSFFLARKVFNSSLTGIYASLIVALSFNHTVWSGFIMTESIGVFILMLFLLLLFNDVGKKHKLFESSNIFLGVVFGIAVFTRYEYSILLFPLFLLIARFNPTQKVMIINFLVPFMIVIFIFLWNYYPIPNNLYLFIEQFRWVVKYGVIFVFTTIIAIIFFSKKQEFIKKSGSTFSQILVGSTLFIIVVSFIPKLNTYSPIILSGLKDAVTQDFLLFSCFIIGSISMSKLLYKTHLVLIFVSIFLLSIFYYRVNPDMFRYYTHLLPLMVIPASFGLHKIVNYISTQENLWKYTLFTVLSLLLLVQFFVSINGLRNVRNGSLMSQSYEEASARKLQTIIKKDEILIVSLPEPYFFFTKNSTHSITDTEPFIHIDHNLDNKNVILVMDMGMEKYFPNFTKLVNEKLQDKISTHFFVNNDFLIGNQSFKETKPVRIFRLTLDELRRLSTRID